MPGAHQASYPFGFGKLVPVLAGVEGSVPLIQPYGFHTMHVISVHNFNFVCLLFRLLVPRTV